MERVEPQPIEEALHPCQGISLTHSSQKSCSEYKQEYILWATHTNLATPFNKHRYCWDISKKDLRLFHEDCQKVGVHQIDQACPQCSKASGVQNAAKIAMRYNKKHWICRIVHARLFKSDEAVFDLIATFKGTMVYQHHEKSMDEFLAKSNHNLQSLLGIPE